MEYKEINELLHEEYCKPSGASPETVLEALTVPPLNTVVRANEPSAEPSADEEIIRQRLYEENRARLSSAENLSVRPVQGIPAVWMIQSGQLSGSGDVQGEERDLSPVASLLPVVVDRLAGESCLRGAHIYAQGIMGCAVEMKKGDRVRLLCDIEGTCLKGRAAPFDGKVYYLGEGIAQYSRSGLFSQNAFPSGIGIFVDRPRYPLLSLNSFANTHSNFVAQNLPSCVAVQVLDPQPGELVMDCCAAPGGKTRHIASLMRTRGHLMALEKSLQRTSALKKALADLEPFLEVYCADAARAHSRDFTNILSQQRPGCVGPPPYPKEIFDRILVDAPCSGSGLRPRLSLKSLHAKQIRSCSKLQKSVLTGVIPLLKPGGVLVYSTCSVLKSEDEDVVSHILGLFPEMQLVRQEPFLGVGGFASVGLSTEESSLLQRFSVVPSSTDTIGFFIAKMVKIKSSTACVRIILETMKPAVRVTAKQLNLLLDSACYQQGTALSDDCTISAWIQSHLHS